MQSVRGKTYYVSCNYFIFENQFLSYYKALVETEYLDIEHQMAM